MREAVIVSAVRTLLAVRAMIIVRLVPRRRAVTVVIRVPTAVIRMVTGSLMSIVHFMLSIAGEADTHALHRPRDQARRLPTHHQADRPRHHPARDSPHNRTRSNTKSVLSN